MNSAYSKMLNMPKDLLLSYNVHDFLDTGQIDICISDIVYKDKKQVIMFQDVEDTQGYGRKPIRQIVISRPIFNDKGEVSMILATVRPLDKLNDIYYRASQNTSLSSFQLPSRSGAEREDHMIAESEEMKRILEVASTVATVDTSILITGESGTGKEVVAQYVHQASPRSKKNLVVINCASLPEHLLEAELFGYEKGAFTGASAAGKKGLFEEADGSTLFLDEINSMPIDLQGKILRAIETKTIQRVGSTVSKKVDFRVLSATNEDLEKLVEEKRFRADLYYRLAVVPIHLPPLRERKADILPLAEYFLSMFCRKYSKDKAFTDLTRQTMMSYCWPGNVRELKNFVERSVVRSVKALSLSLIHISSSGIQLSSIASRSTIFFTAHPPMAWTDSWQPNFLQFSIADSSSSSVHTEMPCSSAPPKYGSFTQAVRPDILPSPISFSPATRIWASRSKRSFGMTKPSRPAKYSHR